MVPPPHSGALRVCPQPYGGRGSADCGCLPPGQCPERTGVRGYSQRPGRHPSILRGEGDGGLDLERRDYPANTDPCETPRTRWLLASRRGVWLKVRNSVGDVREPCVVDRSTENIVGPYHLEALLDPGRMGSVYRARHLHLGNVYALKWLPREFPQGSTFRKRFFRESAVAAGIRHPNFVLLYDYGEDRDRYYLVTELVTGQSLRELVAPGRFPLAQALLLLEQLAAAVDYLRTQGIVHGDLKPSNIMVGDNGHLTLIDLGIAKRAASIGVTQTGSFFGTPEYIAPEQLLASDAVGPSVDHYALGVIAYEMLTGTLPFVADTLPKLIDQIAHLPPASPRSLCPELSADMEAVLLRQLAKKPGARYASAGAFVEALRATLDPSSAATTSALPAVQPAPERLEAGAGGISWMANRTPCQSPERGTIRPRSSRTLTTAGAVLILGVLVLYGLDQQSGAAGPDQERVDSPPPPVAIAPSTDAAPTVTSATNFAATASVATPSPVLTLQSPPTDTPIPPTPTPSPIPPTETVAPIETPEPAVTPAPAQVPVRPTNTSPPRPTSTRTPVLPPPTVIPTLTAPPPSPTPLQVSTPSYFAPTNTPIPTRTSGPSPAESGGGSASADRR